VTYTAARVRRRDWISARDVQRMRRVTLNTELDHADEAIRLPLLLNGRARVRSAA